MESNCSSNRFNEMNKSSKQRCDSLPINLNCNEMEKSNNKEFFSVTFDGFTVVPTIQESNSMNKLANRPRIFRRQLLVLITLAYGNFWVATCVSLQAPFFPREAELKGATPTQYGFVFGIYELVVCLTCPLFGKLIAWVSPNFLCEVGLFVAGASTILFGLLDKAPFGTSFIVLALVIRIVEGIGSAAFMTASYTVMASEFPDKIATTFSLLETCFGLGLILGPTLGGAFYELGGFIMPFAILGIFLLTGGGVTLLLMPTSGEITERKSGNFLKFISDVGILLDALAIMTSLNFIGFNSATLEPHLRQFELSPIIIGCIFVISGGIYAITAPIWGKLCDIGINPKIICLFGSILCCIGLIFIGPLNFINIETKLWLIMTSLVFIGLGISAKLVSAFVSSLHDSIKRRGFPDDISTYGLVSALFFSSCSMGAFIGPSLGGFLLEKIGYRKSTAVVLIADIIMVLLVSLYMIWRKNFVSSNEEREPIIRERSTLYSSSESIKDANK